MFNKKKPPPIKSLLAHGCQLTGNFNFADGLRLDGEMHGDLLGQADKPSILVISETAHVTGQVQADHVIINGQVDGPVLARSLLELQPKARVTGDVTYKILEMHQGALVAGRLCPLVADLQVEEKPTLKLAANNQ
ncbi:MAG: polymer-forming cytoskeletal protein [Rhodoferax sp.]|uniref:bactofilin family protein n=1 Tax=Rhodoferax sp. TaxID=50421 RepID=UPI001B67F3CB|nr:polymer-forming cytoskeletal protein [Rhodoferax sp.]MBP9905724.1 polymer-forming cytoskeletal protein [Rhodoferax sp.]